MVDLAAEYSISRPAISKHLRLLTEAGLVSVVTRGRERHYAIDREGLDPVQDFVSGLHAAGPPIPEHALDALGLEVRRTTRERVKDQTKPHESSPEEHTA